MKKLLLIFISIFILAINLDVKAASKYSNVLDDLKKDSTFDISDYPENTLDYSINVIQIAESDEDELFIYTYTPSKNLKSSSLNISIKSPNEQAEFLVKTLTLINSNGVFQKYLVNNFKVNSNESTRYYNISSIYRLYDSSIDKPDSGDNTTEEIAYEVGQQWYAFNQNGVTKYQMIFIDTVLITSKHVGFVRYSNGFKLYVDSCDGHYVAFNTDKKIDKLIDAEVYYVSRSKSYSTGLGLGGEANANYGDPVDNYVKLSDVETASNTGDGLFGKKYTWNRIESVDHFIKNEDLTDETIKSLKDKSWVLRFAETDYTVTLGQYASTFFMTEVSKVTILRLKFETDGITYDLGVVDNRTTGDINPDNNNTTIISPGDEKSLWDQFVEWFIDNFPNSILITLVGVAIFLAAAGAILALIWKILIWFVSWPFKKILGI